MNDVQRGIELHTRSSMGHLKHFVTVLLVLLVLVSSAKAVPHVKRIMLEEQKHPTEIAYYEMTPLPETTDEPEYPRPCSFICQICVFLCPKRCSEKSDCGVTTIQGQCPFNCKICLQYGFECPGYCSTIKPCRNYPVYLFY